MLRVLAVTKNRSVHFPQLVMAGKLPQLVFGCDAEQAFERDPEWPDRPAALIEINPTFLAALPCLSPNNALPVEMALHVAVGVFRALAALHRAGFVHRLVTPYSFTVPFPLTVDAIQRNVTIFDFSHVLPFPIKPRAHVPFVGTFRYSSVRAHYGREQGPSDDVISLIYMVAEFVSGRLPWRSVRDEPTIVSLKKDFHRTDCFRRLPREFRNLYREMNLMPGPAMIEHASILSKMQFSLARRESPLKKTLPHFVNTEVLSKELLENRRKRKAAKN
uniref:Protein kinase domain-containing protein n=1 Tax=Panagrolaimus sp. JU765 TaxID=591449 RepID=A0AC34QRD8_9BILA